MAHNYNYSIMKNDFNMLGKKNTPLVFHLFNFTPEPLPIIGLFSFFTVLPIS